MLELNRIYNMDCIGGMKLMDDESVELVVTSPPYYNAREYVFYGTLDEYKDMMKSVFTEVYRVLGNHRYVIVNVGDVLAKVGKSTWEKRKLALGAWFTVMLQDVGFIYIDDYIWDKGEPQSKRNAGNPPYPYYQYPINCYEHILVFAKHRLDKSKVNCPVCGSDMVSSNWYLGIGIYSFECKNPECGMKSEHGRGKRFSSLTVMRDTYKTDDNEISDGLIKKFRRDIVRINPVIKINSKGENNLGHTAPFPMEIPEMSVQFFSGVGDVVLDPFTGSGTTAIAAINNGRKYIGFETNPDYVRIAEKRIKNESTTKLF